MQNKSGGIAARAGHWSARHRKTAIFGWLAFIVIAFMIGGSLGQKKPTDAQSLDGEQPRRDDPRERRLPKDAGEMVLVQSKTATGKDPAFKAAVADVTKTVSKQKRRRQRRPPRKAPVSKDGHSALVQFDIKGDPETADRAGPAGPGRHRRVAARHPAWPSSSSATPA